MERRKSRDIRCQIAGGETGIRTLDTLSSIHAFQACAFSHSAISPLGKRLAATPVTLPGPANRRAAGIRGLACLHCNVHLASAQGVSQSGVAKAISELL